MSNRISSLPGFSLEVRVKTAKQILYGIINKLINKTHHNLVISSQEGSWTKHPGTKHPMQVFDTPDKTSHKDLPPNTKHLMLFLSPLTKHLMPFLPSPDKTSHFMGYFLVKATCTYHHTFLVSLDRFHVTI